MEKRVMLISEKKHVAVICDPVLTVKDIMDRLNLGELKLVAYRDMGGPDNMRQWRLPNGDKMGHAGHGWNHAVRKEVGTSAMANLLYGAIGMWCKKAGGVFRAPIQEKVKPGTIKKMDEVFGKASKSKAIVTVSFSGTVAEVEQAIQEYAKGRK